MECPYCEATLEVCGDDWFGYDEDRRHEHECEECGKTFVFTTSISYHYEPEKADCLNGSEHKLKMSTTFPRICSKMHCEDCDFSRKPTEQEFLAHGIDINEGKIR
jgi:hypothetical protein